MSGTKRIRWHTDDDGETTGYVGNLDRPVFRIWPPDDDGDCLLFLYLAGHAGDLYHGATIDGQQAQAERLLEEFVSSLGAAFPESCPSEAVFSDGRAPCTLSRNHAGPHEFGDTVPPSASDIPGTTAATAGED